MANQYTNSMNVKMGIVYESDLGDDIHHFHVRAFPTYVLFQNGAEVQRVQGANLTAVEQMIQQHCQPQFGGEGETLGTSQDVLNPEQARQQRLAKFATVATESTPMETTTMSEPPQEEPDKESIEVEMKEAIDEDDAPAKDPTADLDPAAIQTLTESMGLSLIRAQKGLLHGNGGTVEGAVEWLMQHQDDQDIDQPISADTLKAQSYKCNDCGKILSNMANLELHANKTGHSDFEESTEYVKPLTEEEKKAKIDEIKELLKQKRAEREEAEKVDHTEREKQRREMGKQMAKTREELDLEQRRREAYLRKKEKEDFKKERARLRAELAKDKADRKAHHGKKASKLGVEGYDPDGIQYDVVPDGSEELVQHQKKKPKVDPAKIDEYIAKVSSYKAGGDGGKCLKVLKAYVGNVADHPEEEKYKTINMDNKAFKTKVKPFLGAKNLLLAVGFSPNESGDAMVLREDADQELLANTKGKLEAALAAYD